MRMIHKLNVYKVFILPDVIQTIINMVRYYYIKLIIT